jgi:hypothetical protein
MIDPDVPMSSMTLRDYFAAKAMQALIQASTTLSENDELNFERVHVAGIGAEIGITRDGGREYTYPEYFAQDAYFIADNMLKERENEPSL